MRNVNSKTPWEIYSPINLSLHAAPKRRSVPNQLRRWGMLVIFLSFFWSLAKRWQNGGDLGERVVCGVVGYGREVVCV
jgi:hypothetical protein